LCSGAGIDLLGEVEFKEHRADCRINKFLEFHPKKEGKVNDKLDPKQG
jgi:hypothetical protein